MLISVTRKMGLFLFLTAVFLLSLVQQAKICPLSTCLQVKIIKCLVENIVVDISFNQLGGLCTLCFLDEVREYLSMWL